MPSGELNSDRVVYSSSRTVRVRANRRYLIVAIANLIREAKTYRINSSIQTGRKFGMQLLDDALFSLWKNNICEEDTIIVRSNQPGELNTLKYFVNTTFNYPTMAEAYRVAAYDGLNRLF